MGTSDSLDAVVRELYGVDPGEFVAARDRRAAQAREHGEKDLAARIRKLRKPTTAAALVNTVARRHPDQVRALVSLGERMRAAHRDLAGDRLRELTHERHERVHDLVERAEALASGGVGESVRREVAATLEAAVADEQAADAVTAGCLTSALSPSSDVFEAAWLPVGPSTSRGGTTSKPRSRTRREAEPSTAKPSKAAQNPEPSTAKLKTSTTDAELSHTPTRTWQDTERAAAERRRREAEVQARRARDEARKRLRAAEREEADARRRTERAKAALEQAEREVRRHAR
ncbi:hypothetical protein [Saccharomonospora sp. NB11]|uniref:hypothetical protein n=1 Tax=Saccharomonospora sp. NB11 TaxID=1642298 RepID=UPI0018D19DF9|nr:hypothetical protein [Saccharomonospora sp. NB11]